MSNFQGGIRGLVPIMAARSIVVFLLALFSLSSLCCSQATADSPPNILFAIADDWGYGHASAYGAAWVRTPSFDRVAKEGMLFKNAYTPNAKCAPSRACILTGRNSWQLKEAANHICYFPQEFKGWPEALASQGWHMGFTTKGWGPGVAKDANGQARRMTGKAYNGRVAEPPAKGIGKADYAANFEDFLEDAPANQPWCFWYGAIEPHREYEFGSGIKKGGKKLSDIERVPAYWPDNEIVRNDLLDYGFEVEHFDRHLGRMIASLESRGLLENTLIIVTSDHGMPFPRCKGNAYESSNHVPLAIMWKKGIPTQGRTVEDFVSFIDFAPTLVEVAGLKWPATGMADSPGKSLTNLFRSNASGQIDPTRDHVLVGMERHDIGRPGDVGFPIRGIVTRDSLFLTNFEPTRWPACNPETGYLNCDAGATKTDILERHRASHDFLPWKLCFGKRPAEELYDRVEDPDSIQNLALEISRQGQKNQLRDRLFAELREQHDPRMFGDGRVFDEYLHANESNRNFYERYMKGEKMTTNWVNRSDYEPEPFPD